MGEEVIIRSAEQKDISGILEVQKGQLLKNKSLRSAEKEGFLVYPLSEDELKNLISSEDVFSIVAEFGGKIVGYALAYDLKKWREVKPKFDKRILVTSSVKNHLIDDRVIYFRHVARFDNFSGVGKSLEEEIYSLARKRGLGFVIAEILESPLKNRKSLEVHKKRGFVKIGHVDYLDGNFWGLYEKKLF